MAILIDTCSLVMIARNYMPLDINGNLLHFLRQFFNNKEIVLLDTIYEEIRYVSKGVVLEKR